MPRKIVKEELNSQDELLMQLQTLKQSAAWQICVMNLEKWKNETLNEMLTDTNFDNIKELRAEFKAYGKLLNLPDKIIQDLTNPLPVQPNMDPYEEPNN